MIRQAADPEANIIFGAVIDPRMQDEVKLTVIATGFDGRMDQAVAADLRPPALARDRARGAASAEMPRRAAHGAGR